LAQREGRSAGMLAEIDRDDVIAPDVAVHVLAQPGEDQPAVLVDLEVFTAHPMIAAVRGTHTEAVSATNAEVLLTVRQREVVRTPPAHQVLRVAPCLEDQSRR